MRKVIGDTQLERIVKDMDRITTLYATYSRFKHRGELPITVHLYLEKLIKALLEYVNGLGIENKVKKENK